ncbi:CAP domain-containing protein [Halorarius halobius]|uniref:CAP domain-containing protein n=1 Tax=Halorarius halobius TaxID=2962671 RepID=UPI0020CBDF26|nr:CAP domain-containing protein [Halorarius halobius]
MVNKVSLLVVIALAAAWALGVGAFVGTYIEGPSLAKTPTPTPTGSPTSTPAAEPAATATTSATPVETPRPTVAPSAFDERAIERELLAAVNAKRDERDLAPLARFATGDEMARFHSANMADQGYPTHAAGGYTTVDRYERYDLYDRCRVLDDSNTGVRDGQQMEVVAKSVAGRRFQINDEDRLHRNESALASAVVDGWMNQTDSRRTLLLVNAERAGVGVVVADDGGTYVTVDLC